MNSKRPDGPDMLEDFHQDLEIRIRPPKPKFHYNYMDYLEDFPDTINTVTTQSGNDRQNT
jgi:hypothetical protein